MVNVRVLDEKELTRLQQLVDQDTTIDRIADLMGLSRMAVLVNADVLGYRQVSGKLRKPGAPAPQTKATVMPLPPAPSTPAPTPVVQSVPATQPLGLLARAEALADVSAPIRRALEKVHGARDNLEKVLAAEEEKAELRRREAELRAELDKVRKELRGTPTNQPDNLITVPTAAEVRKWALDQGIEDVPVRGVLPARILDAYKEAHA
jgi:hypothetical protein